MWTEEDQADSETIDAGLVDSIGRMDQVIGETTGETQSQAISARNSNQALLDLIRVMKARHAQ